MSFRERLIAFEKRCLANMKEFRCPVHLSLGQEDAAEALHEHIRPYDWLFSTHRSHAHYLAKGGSEQALWDEMMGLESGINRGYSGSQSFCDKRLNFHSTAIIGGLIGVATGTALALKMQRSSAMVVCCIGDAATEQGIFWESLNFAALHTLPIIYLCENNRLSVHAPLYLRQSGALESKVRAFGMSYGEGADSLATALKLRWTHPRFIEVHCTRECAHVSAMEDLRE